MNERGRERKRERERETCMYENTDTVIKTWRGVLLRFPLGKVRVRPLKKYLRVCNCY